MSHSPYAYSYVLIPCLLFDYKAPIVLLQIPYKLCFSVAATPTWSQPEVKVKTQLAENLVVMPRTRSATRSAEPAALTTLKLTSHKKKVI